MPLMACPAVLFLAHPEVLILADGGTRALPSEQELEGRALSRPPGLVSGLPQQPATTERGPPNLLHFGILPGITVTPGATAGLPSSAVSDWARRPEHSSLGSVDLSPASFMLNRAVATWRRH